jgi:hypothetical protein
MLYGQSLTHIHYLVQARTLSISCNSLLSLPSTGFFRWLLSDSIFETHHLDESHFKTASDKLLIFGGLIIKTNNYQTKKIGT